MQTQVRIYRIQPGRLDAWLAEWRAHIVPLRRRYGFQVEAAWASVEGDTFVWMLAYDGEDWDAAERAYYESPERRQLEPDPARHVAEPSAFLARPLPLP